MTRILIVGAGIAGLSMARQLSRYGISFRIIERHQELRPLGCGIALPFNAVRAMQALGLGEKLLAVAHPVYQMTYRKPDGSVLASAELSAHPFENDHFVALKRADLLNLLLDGLQESVEFATPLVSIVQHPESVVVATPEWEEEFDLVVAADGVHSPTRVSTFETEELAIDHGFQSWRFFAPLPRHDLQPSFAFGKTEMFMFYPVSVDLLYCHGHISDNSRSEIVTGDHAQDIRRIFKGYRGMVPRLLEAMETESIIPGRFLSVREPKFYDGRVAFVGDAGNGCSPLLQQGAASAFEDVLCLSAQINAMPVADALGTYCNLRKSRVEWIVNRSDSAFKMIPRMENPVFRMLRNTVWRLTGPVNVNGWKELATNPQLS